MTISGFSFVRNGVKFDYPFLESISSILPICDEFVVAVGKSDDDTLQRIRSLGSPKIRIIETEWDESLRTGGSILAQQTNIALDHVKGDWAFYLQADEVVHEDDLPLIREAVRQADADTRAEGLLFAYKHFYGSYDYIGSSRRWYRHEIRVVRLGIGVRSWGDAQGFRIGGRKLHVRPVNAAIYHYGWVKPPGTQMAKQRDFNKLWHSDEWIGRNIPWTTEYAYSEGGRLERFDRTHPAVMSERMKRQNWTFTYHPERAQRPFRERMLEWFEGVTGWRIGEYRNYELL
jgi:glycosyltransferase involved in cell wall biosynthesis